MQCTAGTRSVTSLGHQGGGEKFSERCPNFLNYVQQIFPGGKKFSRRSFAPPGYGPGRNRFTEHCTGQVARSTCSSSPSLHRYTWVLIRALRNCVVACFSFYGGGDKLHAPLGTRLHEKFAKELQKSQMKIFEPSASQKSQISVFWLQKSQSGNPVPS